MGRESLCCECCTKSVARGSAISLWIFAVACLAIAQFLPSFIRHKINDGINQRVTITAQSQRDNTQDYQIWADNTNPNAAPYWYYVSVFNCTNPADVLEGAKPNLKEIGPFVYRMYTKRLNATFSVDQLQREVVSFKRWDYYVFDAEKSAPLVDTETIITTLRMPLQGLKQSLMANLYVSGGDNIWDNFTHWDDHKRLYSTLSVRDFLFGYNDYEIKVANAFAPTAVVSPYPGPVGNVSTLEEALALPWASFLTGAAPDQQSLRQYTMYNNQTFLEFTLADSRAAKKFNPNPPPRPLWGTPDANRVYGSDGMQFPRYLQPGQTISAWVDDLKREIDLVNYNNATFTYDNIELYRFLVADAVMQNVSQSPANTAYYQFNTPSGFINNTFVEPGAAEIYMSRPHFLGVDPEVANRVTGLVAPDPDRDTTMIDVEPYSGITMHAWKRLQINCYVHPYNYTKPADTTLDIPFPFPDEPWFPKVQPVFWPIFWVNEGGAIPDDDAATFVRSVYGGHKLATGLELAGYIGGSVLVVLASALLWYTNSMLDHRDLPGRSGTADDALMNNGDAHIPTQRHSDYPDAAISGGASPAH